MASRIFHDLLLQRHDHLSRFERQAFWMVAGLLVVHLLVLTPLLGAWHQTQKATAEGQRLADIGPGLDAMIERLDALRQEYLAALQPALDEHARGLELDLARLEASRWQWQQEGAQDPSDEAAEEAAGAPADALPELDRSLLMTEAPRGVVPFPIPEALLPELRQARNRYALLTLLEPLVEEQMLRPRAQTLQRTWDAEVLPLLQGHLDAMGSEVSQWRARLPEAEAGWDQVSAGLSALAAEAEGWTAQPPPQPFWWASPESQPRLTLGLGSHAELLSRPPALARLAVHQQEIRQGLSAAADTWKRRWTDVSSAGETSEGRNSFWLPHALPLFPAALGLLLALLIWGHAGASKALIGAVDRAVSLGSPSDLVAWCGGRVTGRPESAEPGLRRQLLLHSTAAILWMGALAYQVLGPPTDDWAPWIPTGVSAALVLLAACYRLVQLQQGLTQLATDLPPGEDLSPSRDALTEDDSEMAEDNPDEIALRR